MTTHWHVTHSRYIMWIGHCCKQVIFEKVFFPNQYKVFRLCLDFSIIIELKLGIDIFTQCRLWLPSWDQTALRHEKWKCRITILIDLECPNIVRWRDFQVTILSGDEMSGDEIVRWRVCQGDEIVKGRFHTYSEWTCDTSDRATPMDLLAVIRKSLS